ncbi:transcriptional regulator with XRE-family HTH domain [Anaerosolibacter carboniphilus]|uniref:Transcriptional regulator with XRE-family HTH domain n=1 Tax=Anaerosolibacter carboniphilus TaxID=1417629 RepID=A0A841L0Q1_9FIRM|nr:XRE family transcriptional regulator [Anaerosolibacter carboniphilus]MBB6217770.1 transcriptional regulator with XRE-family HTH domain [Anaerosolibacter carboniphilus]
MFNAAVGENVRKIRNSRDLTIEKLAEITGVSKSMLGQIERGEANPTITTVWKIANGLKVPFTALIELPETEVRVIDKSQVAMIVSEDGLYECTPFFPFDSKNNLEMYEITLRPACKASGEPHPKGTMEYIIVFDGEVMIEHGNQIDKVKKDQAIKFSADTAHCYYNSGTETARFALTICYSTDKI